ncbi:MotE family protein [Oceanobacillus iheyensis]|uniref:MotE family protein n=1 Tax=Oceanobacillus iheyensis TaxID=182710 RepID=UPI003636A845
MNNKEEKKKINPFILVFFAGVIPLFVVAILAVFILEMAGVEVVDWAKEKTSNVPIVGEMIKEDQPVTQSSPELETAQAKLQEKQDEVIELENSIGDLESTIKQLEDEILRLEHRDDSTNNTEEDQNPEEEVANEMIQSFTEMKGKQAAQILESIEDDQLVVRILEGMEPADRGEILQRMTKDEAARYTELVMAAMENE